jgi:hypothetical protein
METYPLPKTAVYDSHLLHTSEVIPNTKVTILYVAIVIDESWEDKPKLISRHLHDITVETSSTELLDMTLREILQKVEDAEGEQIDVIAIKEMIAYLDNRDAELGIDVD